MHVAHHEDTAMKNMFHHPSLATPKESYRMEHSQFITDGQLVVEAPDVY